MHNANITNGAFSDNRLPISIKFAKYYWLYGPKKGRKWIASLICSRLPKGMEAIVKLWPGGISAIVSLNDPQCMYAIVYGGTQEKILTKLVVDYLEAGNTFIDVGANFDYYSLICANQVKPGGKIISFEPQPVIAERLKRRIKMNKFEHISVHQAAVGRKSGTIQLYCPIKYLSGLASVYTDNMDIVKEKATQVTVKMVALDEILAEMRLESVDLIKIDVEGYELEVLRGAMALISKSVAPVIIMEIFSGTKQATNRSIEALDLLWSLGYEIFKIGDNNLSAMNSPMQLTFEQNVVAFKPNIHDRFNYILTKAKIIN